MKKAKRVTNGNLCGGESFYLYIYIYIFTSTVTHYRLKIKKQNTNFIGRYGCFGFTDGHGAAVVKYSPGL